MEKTGRNIMVTGNLAHKIQEQVTEVEKDYTFLPDKLKYTSVSLLDVVNNKYRFEASAFSIEAKIAVEKLNHSKFAVEKLYPNNNFVVDAFHAPRFKRKYLSKTIANTIGFLGSAEMLSIKPKAIKYLPISQAEKKGLFVKKIQY
jgi:type I restriction enzyme S subunit